MRLYGNIRGMYKFIDRIMDSAFPIVTVAIVVGIVALVIMGGMAMDRAYKEETREMEQACVARFGEGWVLRGRGEDVPEFCVNEAGEVRYL